ncbi:hypothetical protein BDY19DRAFT_885477 [Irpex rosettiformis]|uniref:Uncharacterized protein n=1 Tax=Irpex rosettiformis TaxID=378272 RepID=A0ACB8UBY2_9APHY|nr:hypothetical protein BDY19DRAFT_885477 [Irpex rosettiformis]
MYSSTSFGSAHLRDQSNDPHRPGFVHSHPQQFIVAGMSSQGQGHSPSLRSGPLGGAGVLSDTLSQSRSHYQPGYLMAPSQSPRFDDAPIVQTKAKMNPLLAGSSAAEFGMDSMFESSRQRQTLIDEDAPPMASANDIVNEVYEPTTRRSTTFDSSVRASIFRPQYSQPPSTPKQTNAASNSKPLYVIVFGYPPDKFSITTEYFRAFGETTEADPNVEISNCFRIGYNNPADALRAVRKNGEVLCGTFMVGVKWADPLQAEALLGSPIARSPFAASVSTTPNPPDVVMDDTPPLPPPSRADYPDNSLSLVQRTHTPPVGTPIRLAPSAAAFKKPGSGGKLPPFAKAGDTTAGGLGVNPTAQASPSKGVLGHVSDLIFGW